jgi:hypothetical protein
MFKIKSLTLPTNHQLFLMEDTRLSFALRQHMQLLAEQIEQQKHEIDLFNSQFKILKEQLKLEAQTRLDAQVAFSFGLLRVFVFT